MQKNDSVGVRTAHAIYAYLQVQDITMNWVEPRSVWVFFLYGNNYIVIYQLNLIFMCGVGYKAAVPTIEKRNSISWHSRYNVYD